MLLSFKPRYVSSWNDDQSDVQSFMFLVHDQSRHSIEQSLRKIAGIKPQEQRKVKLPISLLVLEKLCS